MDPEPGDQKTALPGPSLWPIGVAVGIACILVGLIVSWWVVAIGGGITLVFGFLWMNELMGRRAPPAPVAPEAEVPTTPGPRRLEGPATTRTGFLSGLTLGLGAVIGGIVTIPPVFLAVVPPFLKQGTPDVDLGPLENFPQDQWVITKFFLDAKQGEVFHRTAFVRSNGLLDGEPSFTILSSRCVHLGCPVQANGPVELSARKVERSAGGQQVELIPVRPAGFGCPCHGGQYDTEGNRTAGPPVRALDRYAYAIRSGRIFLTGVYSVGTVLGTGAEARIKKYKLAGPGQHVDGWEQIFYPLQPPH